ncbi:hypothetical protein A3A84_01980 [Candidatus Collierbacteria bacterium RIFCSPLOWO2_01_FULL_50_23]|nr:MAG: hypothetical protein A3A84_01980 [Candidatus Collierbacteria bacterium RIFCSPLOWO2_01_FULL_50_23]
MSTKSNQDTPQALPASNAEHSSAGWQAGGQGFSLVEILVSISLMMVIVVGSLSANSLASNSVGLNKLRSRANLLAKEGMEALLSVRAGDFNSLGLGDFHPVMNSGLWTLVSGSETVGQFTRTITLSPVMRDMVCDTPVCGVVEAGGLIDRLSFYALVKVTWKENNQDKDYQLNTLVTYWR